MTTTDRLLTEMWAPVRTALSTASAIAFDGCHKIYVVADAQELERFIETGYEPVLINDTFSAGNAFELVQRWFDFSCLLKFVNLFYTPETESDSGHATLIEQFHRAASSYDGDDDEEYDY